MIDFTFVNVRIYYYICGINLYMEDYKEIDYQQKKKDYAQLLLKNAFELMATDMFGAISEKIKQSAKERKMINLEQFQQVRKDFIDKFIESNKYGEILSRLETTEMTLSDLIGELNALGLKFEVFKKRSLSKLKLENFNFENIEKVFMSKIVNGKIDELEEIFGVKKYKK